jgi:hypothetical protein
MKTFTTLLLLATVLCVPAWAKEKCTSACHLFEAWAMVQLCPNLTLIHTPETDADYKEFVDGSRPMRQLQNDALRWQREWMRHGFVEYGPHVPLWPEGSTACHPKCTGTEDDVGTVCQYIKEK